MRYLHSFDLGDFIPTDFTSVDFSILPTKFTSTDFDATDCVNAIYIYCLRSVISLSDVLTLTFLIVN